MDSIFESIGEIQDAQEQAEEIKETLGKSTYKSLFDGLANQYDLVEVEEISEEIKNGGTPKRSNDDYWGGDIPWLKSGELNEGYLSTSEEGLTEEGLSSGSAKLMEPKTVLIAMYGATRGKTAILEKEMTTNQAICGVLVNEEKIIPEFLQFCIKAKKRELVGKGRGGGQDNINQTTIKETKIPLPPLEVQEEILEKISDIEELLEKDFDSKRKKITEDLPKSVLAEAFKGNLVDFGAMSESDELGSTDQEIREKQDSSFDGEGQQSLGEYH
ncbi:restriction endonuclease subunit S [Halorubrum vacuolatum]|nr:restriction endonuclease subunit S [Halorubrum vacuolatum]